MKTKAIENLTSCHHGPTHIGDDLDCLGQYRQSTATDKFSRIQVQVRLPKPVPFLTSPKGSEKLKAQLCPDCPVKDNTNRQPLHPDPSKLNPFLYGDNKVTIYTGKGPFQVPEIEYLDGQGGVGRRPIKVEKNEYSEPE